PLVDKEGCIMAVLSGQPKDSEFLGLTQEVAEFLEEARTQIRFRPDQRFGRCGTFSVVSTGILFGGRQQVPGNLALPQATNLVLQQLFATPRFFRIAGVEEKVGLFRSWNPNVHTLYVQTLDALVDHHAGLTRNFEHWFSAFAAATLNFGPATVTLPHIDALNLAWGWCAITALGSFNAQLGGHLVLWDLRLIFPFSAGSTILIPSAILRHSNVGIAPTERWYSFTQYSAAVLFRWVDNGFLSDVTVTEDIRDDPVSQALRAGAQHTRWEDGINSFRRWGAAT
ncbi:hypothetical protein K438DRAFT_1644425, partial [Mycena galopus ATCC 62051]